MKNNNHFLKALMAAVLLIGGNNISYAQFGSLKGLANKAKNAAKKQVDDATLDAKNSARSSAKQQAENAVNESKGETWEWPSKHYENDESGYEIAKAGEWNAESDYNVICADLAYRLMNIHKLDEYIYVTRHQPPFADVMSSKLKVISGLAHASGMSSFNDGVTDKKQKDLLEHWQRELTRVVNSEERSVDWVLDNKNFGYGGNPKAVRRWAEYVDLIGEQKEKKDKVRAFNMAYNVLERSIMAGNIKGDEQAVAGQLAKMAEGYKLVPEHLRSNYASSMDFASIKAMAEQRGKELAEIQQKASADRSIADAKYRKDELLRMYKEAASAGRYMAMPAAKGNSTEAFIKKYVTERYPEWGKIIRVSAPMNYNVHRDRLGNIKYRSHSVVIVCEDQGYKAVHSISMHEEYFGSKYRNGVPNSDRWNSGPLNLVK